MAAADGVPCDHCDNRFRTGAYLSLEVEHVEAVDSFLVAISCIAADFLVAAGAKSISAFSRQDDAADLLVMPRIFKGMGHFVDSEWSEGIAHFRAVDCDLRYAIVFVIFYVFVITMGSP